MANSRIQDGPWNGDYFPDYSGLQDQVKIMKPEKAVKKPPKVSMDVVTEDMMGDGWDEDEIIIKVPEPAPVKRGPGRPRKNPQPESPRGRNLFADMDGYDDVDVPMVPDYEETPKRGPGRPKKATVADMVLDDQAFTQRMESMRRIVLKLSDDPTDLPDAIQLAGAKYIRKDTLSKQESVLVDRIAYLADEEIEARARRDKLQAEVKALERKLKALQPPERKLGTKVPILEPQFVVDPEPEEI